MRRCARTLSLAGVLACSVASPATEVKEALARAAPVEISSGGALVVLPRAEFADVAVSLDRGRALVVAVVEADGRVSAGGREVALRYVGREAFAMERCPARRWCPVGAQLPALAGVVEALVAAPRSDGRLPVAWQIRIERDRATAGEDAERPEGGPAARAVFELARAGEGWKVAAGP